MTFACTRLRPCRSPPCHGGALFVWLSLRWWNDEGGDNLVKYSELI